MATDTPQSPSQRDPFDTPMWKGLMEWMADMPWLKIAGLTGRVAHERARQLLAEDHLDELTLDEFNENVWGIGEVTDANGEHLSSDALVELGVEEVERRIADGEMTTTGNQNVLEVVNAYEHQKLFKGKSKDEVLDTLRRSLRELLYGDGDDFERYEEVRSWSNGLGPAYCSLLLYIVYPGQFCLMNGPSRNGLEKLAQLLGAEEEWAGAFEDYQSFNAMLHELLAQSKDVFADMVELDVLLYSLFQLGNAEYWKVAIAIGMADREELVRRCKDQGCAAIGWPPDEEHADPTGNIDKFKEIKVGDYVVMHVSGGIGGVGRVTRPYYELDREQVDDIDGHWCRRIGVDWLIGEREYGHLLPGAKQRLTVIDIDEATFWQLAAKYAGDPRFEEALNPPPDWRKHLSSRTWIFQCNPERWDLLAALEKPMPYEDFWAVNQHRDAIHAGDLVYLWLAGDNAGIYGIAETTSEVREKEEPDEFGPLKVDLRYLRRVHPPILKDDLKADAHTAKLSIIANPQGTNFKVDVDEAKAIAAMLPADEYFVLVVGKPDDDASEDEVQRYEEECSGQIYHYSHNAAGNPRALSAAIEEGRAVNYLLYHTGPEYAFLGFGWIKVGELAEGGRKGKRGSLELQHYPFAEPLALKSEEAQEWMGRTDFLRDGLNVFSTNSIFSISAEDYRTVLDVGITGKDVTTEAVAAACYSDRDRIEQIEAMLKRKGQMIFYGPPGTGKTYVALELAKYLTEGDDKRSKLIQFHPSYAYEDFMLGIKPESVGTKDGTYSVSYPVRDGVFKGFCEEAAKRPGDTFVFIIDEINRGNIAKIFGELMFLLEYRNEEIELAYAQTDEGEESPSPKRFRIPENVLIIGTMNTADRSIALVDFALRRRFAFYPFYPDDEFCEPVLAEWLKAKRPEMSHVAGVVKRFNEKVVKEFGRDMAVGHSHFMVNELDAGLLEQIWEFQIMPLIEEYLHQDPERREEFKLDTFLGDNAETGGAEEDAEEETVAEQADTEADGESVGEEPDGDSA